ncbi:MAG: hypothetical protein ABIO70_14500 [Pseudomonadota bacterium]
MRHLLLFSLLASACYRPSDPYDVHLYGSGTDLDSVLPAPAPMGGMIEYARFRFWGTNLGLGLTGLYGDAPRADGTGVTLGYAYLGYPLDTGFDRNSSFLSPGPPLVDGQDACFTRTTISGYFSFMEYVDVGDHIALTDADGGRIVLERDPSTHHRPAGESWYAGYGGRLMPVVQENELLPDTWRSDAAYTLSFPGTVAPPDSTLGVVPYPLTGAQVQFPADLEDFALGGQLIRKPGSTDVHLPGPWTDPVELTWTPSQSGQPVTVVLRYLGWGDEGSCDCNTPCGAGFSCLDGLCVGTEGAGWHVLGELACTVVDDGSFTLKPAWLQTLERATDPDARAGYVLAVARISEGTVEVADALTYNGKRVTISPVRTRVSDILWTRLEAP